MLYVFIAIIIIASVILIINSKKNEEDDRITNVQFRCFIIAIIFLLATVLSILSFGRFAVKTDTISTDNFVVSNFDIITTSTKTKMLKVSGFDIDTDTKYKYYISQSNNHKTISLSLSDKGVHSISVSVTENKEVNHLTIKHNTYFNYLTLTTFNEDEYVFSHKDRLKERNYKYE